ncbi:MAG: FliI/YscN family ATPase [Acidimicrobiales bacterium]|nr:FliI/YscN family ATPase [Acidimicrobiales bacterium]
MTASTLSTRTHTALCAARPVRVGQVRRVVGLTFEVDGVDVAIGDAVKVGPPDRSMLGEVVAIGPDGVVAMPLGHLHGLRAGDPVEATGGSLTVPVGRQLLGRVLDGLGSPIDEGPSLADAQRVELAGAPPHPLRRPTVDTPLHLGVRVLDTLVPVGRGQRIGIMAGSGVGKSSLLSMIMRGTDADVSVLALIGERGREVREFIERDLGPEGLARSVVVVATSEAPALVRLRAAFAATRIAEWFRDQGAHVNLLMDSLTRFSMAQREIGLSAGEVPATRGYPPSVFALMPRLLERAGASEHGSITGIYTVLVEGDDLNDPIGDTARSLLDGHIALSRRLASAGHFPTVDVLESVSRVAPAVTTAEQQALVVRLRQLLAAHREAKDLIEIGAYQPGSNALVDEAVARHDAIEAFLRQDLNEVSGPGQAWQGLAGALGLDPATVAS